MIMKAVQVKYTVQESYVEENKDNIRKVMLRLQKDPIPGMLYSSYTLEDGQSFVHINICKDEETMAKLNDVQEFQDFRAGLKASKPISPPNATKLIFVGAGFEF
jgi:hypothetical protein